VEREPGVDREPDTRPLGQPVPGGEPAHPDLDLPEPARPNLPGLTADPRVPVWIRRAIFALVAGVSVGIWQASWRWGLTAAAAVAILDTIYQSKAMSPIPAHVRATSAQRRTRRRLMLLRASGVVSLHGRAIPGSDSIIDHLVIGPAGVFAIDSERWDRRLPIRTTAGGKGGGAIYHGPFSQTARLAHARWEAAQAARLISATLRQDVSVSPAMVIYGPMVPWGVATLRGVEVFGGRQVGKFFRRAKRRARGRRLDIEQIGLIYEAADRALPPAR
jgi:hypothetical protein